MHRWWWWGGYHSEPLLVGARGFQMQHKVPPRVTLAPLVCLFVTAAVFNRRKGSVKLQLLGEPTRDPLTRARKTVSLYIYEFFCMGELF